MSLNSKYQDEFILLQNLREGDASAFHFIYRTHYRPLGHFAYRFIKDPAQVEDIIAESFVTVWRKRTEFETFRGLTAFLYTCTRNACLSYLRKVKRHETSHFEIGFLSNQSDHLDDVESLKEDLIHCSIIEAQKLPPAMKDVFQLLFIEGFSTAEIAEKLKISIHTVRNQKVNAIKKIRAGLSKKGLLSWFFL